MVFTDSPCLLRVGIQGIGSIPLDGVNVAPKDLVGGRVVRVFSVRIRPLTKAYFLALFILILSTLISPFIMAHERNQNLFSGTKEKPAVHHYGGINRCNSVFVAVHQNNDGNARQSY